MSRIEEKGVPKPFDVNRIVTSDLVVEYPHHAMDVGYVDPAGRLAEMYGAYLRLASGAKESPRVGVSERMRFIRAIFDSMHVLDVNTRLRLYDLIPSVHVTGHTANMKRFGQLWGVLAAISPEDFETRPDEIVSLMKEFSSLAHAIVAVYTDDGLLPNFAVSRLVKAAYAGKDVTAIRFDWDISRLNAKDTSGSLADEFIPEVGDWIITRIVNSVDMYRTFGGIPPVAIRYPERTSFAVFGSNGDMGRKFVGHVLDKLHYFEVEIHPILLELQEDGWIASDVDLSHLGPRAAIHHTTLKLKDFMHEYVRRHGLGSIDRVPRHVVVQHVLSEMKRLAAQSTFLKAFASPAEAMQIGGLFVYGDEALPSPRRSLYLYRTLQRYIKDGRGTISFGRFGYQDEKDPEMRALLEFPDVARNLKDLYAPTRFGGGGAIEHLMHWVERFTSKPELARSDALFRLYGKELEAVASLTLNMGEEGRRDFRYTSTFKSTRRRRNENADFFVEQVSMMNELLRVLEFHDTRYDLLATVEVDDCRAFGMSFPKRDDVDGPFQMIKKLMIDTADELGMFPPIIAPEGDQIRLAVPSRRMDGEIVSPETFLRRYQDNLRRWFEERNYYFQPYAKVKHGEAVLRIPVWINDDGEYAVSKDMPRGSKPFKKVVTVTIAWTLMPDLSAQDGARRVNEKVRLGFKYIDAVGKTQKGPHIKEGFVRLPDSYANGSNGALPQTMALSGGGYSKGMRGPCERFSGMGFAPGIIAPFFSGMDFDAAILPMMARNFHGLQQMPFGRLFSLTRI